MSVHVWFHILTLLLTELSQFQTHRWARLIPAEQHWQTNWEPAELPCQPGSPHLLHTPESHCRAVEQESDKHRAQRGRLKGKTTLNCPANSYGSWQLFSLILNLIIESFSFFIQPDAAFILLWGLSLFSLLFSQMSARRTNNESWYSLLSAPETND